MSDPEEQLYQSYRQSLREFFWIAGAWLIFVTWNVASGYLLAFRLPETDEGMATLFGVPRWVFFTVLLPWLFGNLFIVWFATRFMKDTELDDGN